jgi:S-adenosylmethionine:diacylglycerol 3-amino-3-carboxypropyl transferase
MTTAVSADTTAGRSLLDAAVHQHDAFSVAGLFERAFTFAFRDLVYAQIWEDPHLPRNPPSPPPPTIQCEKHNT